MVGAAVTLVVEGFVTVTSEVELTSVDKNAALVIETGISASELQAQIFLDAFDFLLLMTNELYT